MERKTRRESFLGLHFDFHAAPLPDGSTPPVGARTTAQDIDGVIDAFQPDYLQCDCKGHPGYSSYPTKAGNPYPNLIGDPLHTWRDATARRGVALYVHYSGVIDERACALHPEWAAVKADGEPHKMSTSTFGPYGDELLIPQLKELAGDYGVDGIWLDGECWGTALDYGPAALARFMQETGVNLQGRLPVKAGDPYFEEYKAFSRRQFVRYLNHYIDAVHREYPRFQIASNWSYSAEMPQKVDAPVDFLSGDYTHGDSYNSARFNGRILAPQGVPWDLMAWGFRYNFDNPAEQCPKHPVQLMQEAAGVLALGGGFQCYINQRRDGSLRMNEVENLRTLAAFCRARQPFCHKAEFLPQAVLVNSTADHYARIATPFGSGGYDAIHGMTQLLCDIQQSLEIRSEHTLRGQMQRWPLIIVPQVQTIEGDFRDELLAYAQQGGSLLLVGPGAGAAFPALGLEPQAMDELSYLSLDGQYWGVQVGDNARIPWPEDAETLGWCSTERTGDGEKYPAAAIVPWGRGKIALLPMDVGASYRSRKHPAARALLRALCGRLYEPRVTVAGSQYVDVTVLQKDGQGLIQLVNTGGGHGDRTRHGIDEIPPVGPLTVRIACPAPVSVTRQPQGKALETVWQDGVATVVLDSLVLYDILVVSPWVSE